MFFAFCLGRITSLMPTRRAAAILTHPSPRAARRAPQPRAPPTRAPTAAPLPAPARPAKTQGAGWFFIPFFLFLLRDGARPQRAEVVFASEKLSKDAEI